MSSPTVTKLIACVFLFAACSPQDNQLGPYHIGVVSTATSEATDAGFEILQKGGNAIDAAVAISFALGVTEPAMSGLGGGTQILMALPGQPPIAINGATLSPAATPVDASKKDLTYHRRSTIPSTVKVLEYVWEKYGSGQLKWAELLNPAIRYAEEGFVIGPFRHKVYKKYEGSLSKSPHHTNFFMLQDSLIPAVGDTLKQPVLAQTLHRLAKYGAEDFYHGEIAQQIAADMEANDGWITLADLNNFPDPVELQPLQTTFRGHDIYSQPPPCGGWTAILALNILENFAAKDLQPNSESRFKNMLLALHLAHKDRKDDPVTDLINYREITARKTDKAYAQQLLKNYSPLTKISENPEPDGETTHFSVVDQQGMAVAVTASINAYFGAAAAAPQLGFLYNTYMDDFELGNLDHPFAIHPGRMNYSSMSPTIVQKNGETVLVIGSPGSARIISAVAQLTQLWIDSELGIQEIIATPRLHAINGKIYSEDMEIPNDWLAYFRAQGFSIAFPTYDLMNNNLNAYFGGVHAIAKEKNEWVGAFDPRRDGKVLSKNKS